MNDNLSRSGAVPGWAVVSGALGIGLACLGMLASLQLMLTPKMLRAYKDVWQKMDQAQAQLRDERAARIKAAQDMPLPAGKKAAGGSVKDPALQRELDDLVKSYQEEAKRHRQAREASADPIAKVFSLSEGPVADLVQPLINPSPGLKAWCWGAGAAGFILSGLYLWGSIGLLQLASWSVRVFCIAAGLKAALAAGESLLAMAFLPPLWGYSIAAGNAAGFICHLVLLIVVAANARRAAGGQAA
jgi:hypothetical protein